MGGSAYSNGGDRKEGLPAVGSQPPSTETISNTGRPGAPGDCAIPSRYDMGAPLGTGGFGRVFAARDTLLGRDVAIKILDHGRGEIARRLHQEVGALRLLDLPGTVRLLDSGEGGGSGWVVMERVDGLPFPGLPLPASWADLAPLAIALFRALARVHHSGFIHGDLKPSNVFVLEDRSVVLLDLGLARAAGAAAGDVLAGTPLYMAPEQLRGSPSSIRSDLYSAGLMIHHSLTGAWPHEPTDGNLLRARRERSPLSLAGRLPGLAEPVIAILDALVALDPARRPVSALDVVRALDPPARELGFPRDVRGPGDLAPLFVGTERLHHHPSAVAGLLWRRAAGNRERIRDLLEMWRELGLVRPHGSGLRMERSDLDRLLAGWSPESPDPAGAASAPGSALALAVALSADDEAGIGPAALVIARKERDRGALGSAWACVVEGLRACWRDEQAPAESLLVGCAVDLALEDRSVSGIDSAIEIIGRSSVQEQACLYLLEAGRMLLDGRRDAALERLARPAASGLVDAERWRLELRVAGVVNGPMDPHALSEVESDIECWIAGSAGEPAARALRHRWRSRLLYRRGRMAEAGAEAESGAALDVAPFDRVNSLLAAAIAWIEAAEADRTVAIAREARDLAAALRLPRLEARAEQLLRAIANRTGTAVEPDRELFQAAGELGSAHIEGAIAVTEASISWRAGHAAARDLAAAARRAFDRAGYPAASLFAQALEIAAGGGAGDPAEVARAACAAGRPDVAVEVLGVLARSGRLRGDWRDAFEAQRRAMPLVNEDWPSGVLSIRQARAAVAAACHEEGGSS